MTPSTRTERGYRAWVALAVLVGLALRLPGLFAGLPDATHPGYSYHPDEVFHLEWANWLYQGQFVPKQFMYGGTLHFSVLHAYATYGAMLGERLPGINALADTLIVGRVANLAFALLTIVLVAQLGRRLFGASVGAVAAAILAVAPAAVFLCSNVRPDTLATLLATSAMLLAARLLQWPAESSHHRLLALYGIGGLLLGAMIALRFPQGTFALALLAASAWRAPVGTLWYRWLFGLPHWLLAAGVLLGYVLASPHTLAHPDIAWLGLRVQWAYQSGAFEDAIGRGPGGWQYGVRMLAQGLSWFLYPLALIGLLLALRRRYAGWLLLSGILPYLILTSFTSWVVVRYVLPLMPLLAIAAALTVVQGAHTARQRWGQRAAQGAYTLALVLMVFTATADATFLRQFTPHDARDEAGSWLATHAPSGDGVVTLWGYQGDVFFNPPIAQTLQQRVVLINEPQDLNVLARDPGNRWLVLNAATYTNMDRLGAAHPRSQIRELDAQLHAGAFELVAAFERKPMLGPLDLSPMFDSQDFQILNPGIRVYRRRDAAPP